MKKILLLPVFLLLFSACAIENSFDKNIKCADLGYKFFEEKSKEMEQSSAILFKGKIAFSKALNSCVANFTILNEGTNEWGKIIDINTRKEVSGWIDYHNLHDQEEFQEKFTLTANKFLDEYKLHFGENAIFEEYSMNSYWYNIKQ